MTCWSATTPPTPGVPKEGERERALVAHLVAQCQDSIHLASMARRELLRRRRYPDKPPLDAYMAVGVDDHRAASGPQLVERFAELWPRATRAAAAGQPCCAASRPTRASPASPAGAWTTCWTSSTTATWGRGWSTGPVALALTGPAGDCWLLGSGDPVAVIRAEAVAYMRALSGRDDQVVLELLSGQASALTPIRQARVVF